MTQPGHQSHAPNVKLYMAIFAILMVLTVITVLVSYLHLPKGPAIALGLAIATLKASLVAAFFMHLKGERALIYWMLALCAVFLVVLFGLPFVDSVATADVRPAVDVAAPPAHHVP